MSETVAGVVGEWVAGLTYDALPDRIRLEAKKALINSVGTAIGGFDLADAQHAINVAKADDTGDSTLLVDGGRVPLSSALLANAVLFNVLGQEETHPGSACHPSEIAVPLGVTVAERLSISGKEFLAAMIAGMEVEIQLNSLDFLPKPRHKYCETSAVYGTLGASVMAAKLLGLDAGQTAQALRLAANFASGLLECLLVGTSEYHFSVANAVPQGYLAARLAASGAKAAPQALEGLGGLYYLFGRAEHQQMSDAPRAVRDRLGKEWGMPEMIYKPYPMHYYNMPFLDGAASLREQHGIGPAAIRAVELVVPPDAARAGALNLGPYESRDAVPGSTAFGVACMLVRGHVRVDDVNDYVAPDVLELMSRTTVTEGATMHAGSLKIITEGRLRVRHGEGWS